MRNWSNQTTKEWSVERKKVVKMPESKTIFLKDTKTVTISMKKLKKKWPSKSICKLWMTTEDLDIDLEHLNILDLGDIKELGPNDSIGHHRPGPTLIQVMACFLTEPCHYLNQGWLIVNWIFRNTLQWNFNQNKRFSFKEMQLKVLFAKQWPFCLGLNVLNVIKISKFVIPLLSCIN